MSGSFPKDLTVKQAVLATLAYFHLFEVPLTRDEISEHLFFLKPDEEKIDIYLRESPLIRLRNGYYGLEASEAFFESHVTMMKRAQEYWKKIRRFLWLFQICPFVDLVCVCNSLPIYAVREDSDIDLLVVTRKNRLFLARLWLTGLTTLLGIKRQGNKIRKRFCLSFYVSEENMGFSSLALKPYDIYLAYWIKTLEPIAGDYSIYELLLKKNHSWLSEYFKTILPKRRFFRKVKPWQLRVKKFLEKWTDRSPLEEWIKQRQLRRAREKLWFLKDKSGTVLSNTMLKFHDHDRRPEIREAWTNLLNQIL